MGEKIRDIVVGEVKNEKIEILTALMDNSFFCLFNGDREILELLKTALIRIKSKLLVLNDVLQKINFTIGLSNIYGNFNDISACINECESCINYKVIKGKNKIIKYKDVPKAELEAIRFIDGNFRKRFMKAIADADSEEMAGEINELVTLLYRCGIGNLPDAGKIVL